MGVKDLWSIISPVCEKKSLWELENKVIAIDLSAWICDSQCIAKPPQMNMYLRNLFFRTSYLLLLGAKPVFVLEGKAPILKANTIRSRQKKQNDSDKEKVVRRTRLKSSQKQCMELLICLGVPCVEAPGEAEAFCAYLNNQGLVDGVVTQDSDAFLYGAKQVFRNFQMAPRYTYDCYSMDEIQTKLGLSRTKLIGYSLLSGSDYNSGVDKVGKETALKFLATIRDEELFQRFFLWKDDSQFTPSYQLTTKEREIEMTIREKALRDESFPDLDVISEFTHDPGPIQLEYRWNKPQLTKFIVLADKKLTWEEDYSVKKMVPMMGRWHLLNSTEDCGVKIVKIGAAHGKNTHYKVTWDLLDVVTTEEKALVGRAYPDLVEEFEAHRNLKIRSKPQKRGRKKNDGIDIKETNKIVTKKLNLLTDTQEESDENTYLNISGIVADFIARPNSNPAVTQLSKFTDSDCTSLRVPNLDVSSCIKVIDPPLITIMPQGVELTWSRIGPILECSGGNVTTWRVGATNSRLVSGELAPEKFSLKE